ncbi:hypothetical protein ACE38F_22630 [Bacillus mycoides]|uniref:hypothetical protein n=1 Tax=Bacillus mycoides TaxID=1405 RepID=UPI0035CA7545
MKDELSINIYLDETDTPFSRYYCSDDVHLSSDLDEKSLKTATFNTFSNLLKEEEYTYARNVKKAIVLFVIGIIVGVIFLKLSSNHAYIAGVLSIVCWVFVWSGTEVYFFENQQIKRNIRKLKNILNINVHKK